MHNITFKPGDTIIREGYEGDTVFLIMSGSVEVLVGDARVGTLAAGQVFGEMCLIEPGPRSATVRALTDVECQIEFYHEFLASIEEHPDRTIAFMKTLVRRLRQMNVLMKKIDPNRRGLRRFIGEWQKSLEHVYNDRDVAGTMVW
jgi:CRP-like cAMP-binding protein